jgi:malonyl-CoA decarboxylase
MVNYLYDLSKVSKNHERFASGGEIAATGPVRSLAAQGAKALA